VRREIKKKMEAYRDRINWPEELRRFVEERIKQLEAEDNMERVVELLRRASWSAARGTAASYVREDRDSG
jgi:hypothetical protein